MKSIGANFPVGSIAARGGFQPRGREYLHSARTSADNTLLMPDPSPRAVLRPPSLAPSLLNAAAKIHSFTIFTMTAGSALGLLSGCSPDDPGIATSAKAIYAGTNRTQGHLSFGCPNGPPVTVTGAAGAPLAPGTVLTGPDVRDVVIDNGVVKVTYELMDQRGAATPTYELGAHMLYRRTGDDPSPYAQALSPIYGDWSYYIVPFAQGAEEVHVLRSIDDVAEVSFVFNHSLDWPGAQSTLGYTPSWWPGPDPCTLDNGCGCFAEGCGVIEWDLTGAPVKIAPYCDQPSCFRRVRSIRLVKTIRVERCAEGYFVGYHSDPPMSPKGGLAANHQTSYGERELGTGGGNAVTWSSSGVVFRHPGQAQHGWMGIDDPPYVSPAGQYPGFPAEQSDGPWWVADLPYFNRANETPFVRYIVMEHPLETGVWAFSLGQLGSSVVHFVNDEVEANGMPTRYQLFIGAMPYVSNDEQICTIAGLSGTRRCFPNEPKQELTIAIQSRIPITWPE